MKANQFAICDCETSWLFSLSFTCQSLLIFEACIIIKKSKEFLPGPFSTKSITGVQKLVSAFIFYKTSWLLLRSNQRKQEISLKKRYSAAVQLWI